MLQIILRLIIVGTSILGMAYAPALSPPRTASSAPVGAAVL